MTVFAAPPARFLRSVARRRRGLPLALAVAAALALAGCESSEEKAERHFQSGMALLEAGDADRALVEFRNVFRLNGFHKEARQTYADVLLERGQTGEAYGQYLRLIEQYPDTIEVRHTLADIAIQRGDWPEVERHGRAAIDLDAQAPASRAIAAVLDYRDAALRNDAPRRQQAAAHARDLLETMPGSRALRRVVIDSLLAAGDPRAVLPEIDRMLEAEPASLEYHMLRFRMLARAEDMEGTGAQLRRMYELFPDNDTVRQSLISWYMMQRDIDGAEGFLRELAGPDTGPVEGHVGVVQFLQNIRSREAAMAELERLVAANAGTPNAEIYRAMHAVLEFEAGRRDAAITALEQVLATAAPGDQTRRIKVMLARLLLATGNPVGARARVEEVLAEDATHVEALKMRAAWRIDEDRPGEAIVDLRTALGQAPRDPEVLTLMAQAHERDGSRELAGERLALAVEVTGGGAEEALRYAAFLIRDGRPGVAENVLVDALRVTPASLPLFEMLGDLRLRNGDFAGVQQVLAQLGALPGPEAAERARTLEAALRLARDRTDDSLAFLRSLTEQEGAGDARTVAMMVEAQLRAGRTEEARGFVEAALREAPRDPTLRMLGATVDAMSGRLAEAEAGYRALIADLPRAEGPVRMLYGLLMSTGREAEAGAVLEAAIAAQPEAVMLQWMQAGRLEAAGDIDGAIAVYEALYAANSANTVIANNLASLITTHRSDAQSLERAFAIARRLRGSDVPAFQDTYGWIEYRRGNLSEALAHLEPAAEGLPDNALVQFHLGMTYAALERPAEAVERLERALELAGESPLAQFDTARETLARLRATQP